MAFEISNAARELAKHRQKANAQEWLADEIESLDTVATKFNLDGKCVVMTNVSQLMQTGDDSLVSVGVRLPRDDADSIKATAALAERGYHVGEVTDTSFEMSKTETIEAEQ